MLGRDVVEVLRSVGCVVSPTTRASLDVTDAQSVDAAVVGHDVVVNCAGWTAVDDAEAHEAEAFAVNALAPTLLARACHRHGARMVHVSTDYVFDGTARSPYTEDSPPSPTSAYGRSKAAGEWGAMAYHDDVLVVRTAWLYGATGRCFPRSIARAVSEGQKLQVVDDQIGQPTWSRDVAELVLRLVARHVPPGIYHATSGGRTSWWGFAREVVASLGKDPAQVGRATTSQVSRPAPRPAFSVLGSDRLAETGVEGIGCWRDRWRVAAPSVLGERAGSAPSLDEA